MRGWLAVALGAPRWHHTPKEEPKIRINKRRTTNNEHPHDYNDNNSNNKNNNHYCHENDKQSSNDHNSTTKSGPIVTMKCTLSISCFMPTIVDRVSTLFVAEDGGWRMRTTTIFTTAWTQLNVSRIIKAQELTTTQTAKQKQYQPPHSNAFKTIAGGWIQPDHHVDVCKRLPVILVLTHFSTFWHHITY